jgi:O-antigen/teichoic acid export membrane protein
MWVEESTRTLQTIWIAWCIGGLLALGVAIFYLWPLDWNIARRQKVDWAWIQKGVGQSLIFLGATLALRGIESVDRFFIEFYHSTSMVGVYTFYAGIANIIFTFISTGIFMIYHPLIVKSFQQQDYVTYQRAFRRMAVLTATGILVIAVMASGGVFILLYFINQPIYEMYLPVFFLLLASVSMIVISQLPHYGLYVRRQDKSILFSSLLSFAVALILNALWVPAYHIYGAALSTLVAMIFLALSKYILLVRYTRRHPCHV